MAQFKDHNVTAIDLLNIIPESTLNNLADSTEVDYYAKTLQGKKMFYLLLYGILENDRMSQRTLEDTYNDSVFKKMFDLDPTDSVRRSSISERLSKMNVSYFREIYNCVYANFSTQYCNQEQIKYNLIRVDSTMVAETAGKLLEGMDNKSVRKLVKYSVGFDGLLPCEVKTFTEDTYSSEDNALPEVIRSHIKLEEGHSNIYVVDRGLQSTLTMADFCKEDISFIIRSKDNRKHIELESYITPDTNLDFGKHTLVKDSKVHLYTGGNGTRRRLVEECEFRYIVTQSKKDPNVKLTIITNNFKLTAQEITEAYKKRWDIEVFFRFIKQELNVSHFVSLCKNGIEIILYVTLIVAMLILIYKKGNNIGYKTAKRRLKMEIRDMAISIIIIQCGGDPKLFFNT